MFINNRIVQTLCQKFGGINQPDSVKIQMEITEKQETRATVNSSAGAIFSATVVECPVILNLSFDLIGKKLDSGMQRANLLQKLFKYLLLLFQSLVLLPHLRKDILCDCMHSRNSCLGA
jgi:hypothetical protein